MSQQQSKRRYRNTLDFVESGFRACWQNAKDLVLASQKLIDSGLHAHALSLAVLALEELGKLMAIDGLLYARHDDYKAETFVKSCKSHSTKLEILEVFPLFLLSLSQADPRYGKEQRYNVALAISAVDLKEAGNAVMAELQDPGFLGLDRCKQTGFYVSQPDRGLIAPRDAVKPSLAKAVYHLAWRATTTLDFLLKGGNLERYIERARSVRAALTEEQHQELERRGKELCAKIFSTSGDGTPLPS